MLCLPDIRAAAPRRRLHHSKRHFGIAVALMVLITACTRPAVPAGKGSPPAKPTTSDRLSDAPRLNEATVIRLARQCAQRESIRLREYKSPKVTFKVRRETPTWVVHFERDVEYQYPGSCFDVFIDDRTGSTDLVRCE